MNIKLFDALYILIANMIFAFIISVTGPVTCNLCTLLSTVLCSAKKGLQDYIAGMINTLQKYSILKPMA
jgi:hypothetical protein